MTDVTSDHVTSGSTSQHLRKYGFVRAHILLMVGKKKQFNLILVSEKFEVKHLKAPNGNAKQES